MAREAAHRSILYRRWGKAISILAIALLAMLLGGDNAARAQEGMTAPFLLVATPDLPDPFFSESVILILPTPKLPVIVGLIINRPTSFSLNKLLPEVRALRGRSDTAYFGGPVEVNAPVLLFRSSLSGTDNLKVFDGVYVNLEPAPDDKVLKHPPAASDLRIYLGRAQWDTDQLHNEISTGSWYILPANPSVVFSADPAQLWRSLVARAQTLKVKASRAKDSASGRIVADGPLRASTDFWSVIRARAFDTWSE